MAEGWARSLWGDLFDVYSAGIENHGLDPRAVQAMSEVGVDISRHHSKTLADLAGLTFDYVVTVCDKARESCPVFPASAKVLHRGFDDPPWVARCAKTEEEAMAPFRRVRDEIRAFVMQMPELFRFWEDPQELTR